MSIDHELQRFIDSFNPSCLPIGVYIVTLDGQFILCNAVARRLLGLPKDGPISQKISDFYAEASTREEILQRVSEAEANGTHLENHIIHFKVNGHDVYVQNNCRSLRSEETGEIIGYMGSLADITEEHRHSLTNKKLNDRVSDLTLDIGRILHANTTTLIMVQQALDIVIEALEPNPFGDKGLPPSEDIDKVIGHPARDLAMTIKKLLELPHQESRFETFPAGFSDELKDQADLLSDFIDKIPTAETRASTLRIVAHRIKEIAVQIKQHKFPKELAKELKHTASNLERVTALVAALTTRTAVIQMDYTIRSLREFITADVRMTEKQQRLQVVRLVETISKQLTEFASSSRVKLEHKNEAHDAAILGIERELVRALANLLHNSIKYSWHRDRFKKPWVTIRTFRKDTYIGITFENWGVPIGPNELKEGIIFQLGYRGKWSKDRGRLGTGIGLTDSQEVAKKHQGYMTVESRPARSHSTLTTDCDEYFNQPFLTTVTMFLPEAC